ITSAGTFTTLHQFSGAEGVADGSAPVSLFLVSGGTFIGATGLGGTNNAGTVYTITSAGTLTTIHEFSGTNGVADGSHPILTLADGANFIGTTFFFATNEVTIATGTVFQITAGGVFSTIHQFTGVEGSEPIVTAKNGANFIGTTSDGGSNGLGAAFEMTSAGTLTVFYQFSGTNGVMDGSSPGLEPITDSAGAYYGVDQDGGTNSEGLIFTLTTSGTLTRVYEFCSVTNCADGTAPDGFISSGGALYGTTDNGGANSGGTVYELIPAGGIGGGGGSTNCSYELGSTNATFAASGGADTVSVIASNGCAWSATNNESFITITSGSSGSGNGTVHYSVAANTSSNEQVGTMTIAGKTFTVTESGTSSSSGGCTYELSATNVILTAKGGVKTVSVKVKGTSGCEWTAVSNDPFITITSGTNGTTSGKVAFSVPGNTNTTPLSGTITIADQTVTVVQAKGGCTFKLSPKDGKFKVGGGTGTVKVTPNFSDCDWTPSTTNSWIMIMGGTNVTGKGSVTYTVPENTTTNVLIGTITIAGQAFNVTQAGAR
ncbi:MAG: choice-of-anchor tandem repeat GloVer-containing protein, partial [Verrucomicrobiia bacterium]